MYSCKITALFFGVILFVPGSQQISNPRSSNFRNSESESSEESFSLSLSAESPEKSKSSAVVIEADKDKITKIHEDKELREILCPSGSPLVRYDLRLGKCAEIDTQAHCGTNMIFKEEAESSAYGYCECDIENFDRPLVFHLLSNSCHPIYEQAYCKQGEWLILSKEAKGPICEKRRCSSDQKESRSGRRSKLIFPSLWGNEAEVKVGKSKTSVEGAESEPLGNLKSVGGGRLVPLNGSGPCLILGESSKICEVGEKVIIPSDDVVPRCTSGKHLRRLEIVPNACPPGSYYSIIGYCQPVWDF